MVDVSGENALLQVQRNAVRGSLALATTLTVNSWFLAQEGSVDERSNVEIQHKVFWETGCKVAHSTVYAHSKTTKAGQAFGLHCAVFCLALSLPCLHCAVPSRLNSKAASAIYVVLAIHTHACSFCS